MFVRERVVVAPPQTRSGKRVDHHARNIGVVHSHDVLLELIRRCISYTFLSSECGKAIASRQGVNAAPAYGTLDRNRTLHFNIIGCQHTGNGVTTAVHLQSEVPPMHLQLARASLRQSAKHFVHCSSASAANPAAAGTLFEFTETFLALCLIASDAPFFTATALVRRVYR